MQEQRCITVTANLNTQSILRRAIIVTEKETIANKCQQLFTLEFRDNCHLWGSKWDYFDSGYCCVQTHVTLRVTVCAKQWKWEIRGQRNKRRLKKKRHLWRKGQHICHICVSKCAGSWSDNRTLTFTTGINNLWVNSVKTKATNEMRR